MNSNESYNCLTRRIGSTTYKVKVHFSDNEKETMEDKIMRLIHNDVLEIGSECGIKNVPQMSRQP